MGEEEEEEEGRRDLYPGTYYLCLEKNGGSVLRMIRPSDNSVQVRVVFVADPRRLCNACHYIEVCLLLLSLLSLLSSLSLLSLFFSFLFFSFLFFSFLFFFLFFFSLSFH